jgi:hypothetical protein
LAMRSGGSKSPIVTKIERGGARRPAQLAASVGALAA